MTPRKHQEKIFPKSYAAELLRIAAADLKTAQALYGLKDIRTENLFYLAEQGIEKALKAVLCHRGVAVPLVHELSALVAKFPDDMDLPFGYELDQLTQFATIRRYEESAAALTEDEQREVLAVSKNVIEWARAELSK